MSSKRGERDIKRDVSILSSELTDTAHSVCVCVCVSRVRWGRSGWLIQTQPATPDLYPLFW